LAQGPFWLAFNEKDHRSEDQMKHTWITEEIILLEFAKPCGIHVSFPATVQTTVAEKSSTVFKHRCSFVAQRLHRPLFMTTQL
jgi:hypothetical protein